jgi:hypothetical protein
MKKQVKLELYEGDIREILTVRTLFTSKDGHSRYFVNNTEVNRSSWLAVQLIQDALISKLMES